MRAALIDRHNAAVELRKADRLDEALTEFEAIISAGLEAPETLTMRAHLLGDLGRFDEAVSAYQALLSRHPDAVDAHETLARLLPQIGRGEEALDSYRRALDQAPDRGMLWVSALGTAKNIGNIQQLLAWCDAAEQRFGVDVITSSFRAQALSAMGEDVTAVALIEKLIATEPGHGSLHTTMAHIALRLRDVERAKQAALRATQIDPTDQSGWALLATALRLLDDPRELWLTDYDAHVQTISLAGMDRGQIVECLTAMHRTQEHPADQSLRGGTQTRGTLFDKAAPQIAALRENIAAAVGHVLKAWGNDPQHPFLARNSGRFCFAGSWSVRLRSEGFHISHIHQAGWLSSACYMALPNEVGTSDAGALAFGVPDTALGLDLTSRRIVRPEEGMLVLFPSFMWHGTIPFQSAQPRLTVAFDVLPA